MLNELDLSICKKDSQNVRIFHLNALLKTFGEHANYKA